MEYHIESFEELTKRDGIVSENGYRYYRIKVKDEDKNPYKLEFRSNYQFFLDDGIVWGFGSFSHRRCYENDLRIETFNGEDMCKLKNMMKLYLKMLDLFENKYNLEEHEVKEMLSEYEKDEELESILSKSQVYQAKPALLLPLEKLQLSQ